MDSNPILEGLRELALFDLIGLGLVAVLIALGVWRGLWWQVIRLLGVVVAVLVARVFAPETARWIGETWADLEPRVAHGIAWVSIFLLALGAASLLGQLGQKLIEAMQLGFLNRALGALVGAATGVLIHVALLAGFCQLAPESVVAGSISGTYSERLLDEAGARWRVVLGAEAAGELERLFERGAGTLRGDPAAPGAPQEPGSGVVR